MKKLVFSLAVLFSVAMVSCGGAKTENNDSAAADTLEVLAAEETTTDSTDTLTVAAAEVTDAPAADSAAQ